MNNSNTDDNNTTPPLTSSSPTTLPWESHVSTHPVASSALQKVLNEISSFSGTTTTTKGGHDENKKEKKLNVDLMFLFVGQSHADDFESLVQAAYQSLGSGGRLVAILGGGVIGENIELDRPGQPCLSILTGNLPKGANVEFLTGEKELLASCSETNTRNSNDSENVTNNDDNDGSSIESSSYLLLADPFSAKLESIMTTMASVSSVQISGGISCPLTAGQPSLALDDTVLETGSVLGVKFTGTLGFQTLVAQGCRPIFNKKSFVITEVMNGNIITKLNNREALEVLTELLVSSPEESKLIASGGLLCGIGTSNPQQQQHDDDDDNVTNYYTDDDYLCRQIMGFVPDTGGIAIGGSIQKGDRFIFQLRDKDAAEKDIELMVQRAKTARMFSEEKGRPLAALQISCVARGRGLFGIPNIDITQIQELMMKSATTPAPIAGFYANGEIGPVGLSGYATNNNNKSSSRSSCHLHGFTTVATILVEYTTSSNSSSINNDQLLDDTKFDQQDAWG